MTTSRYFCLAAVLAAGCAAPSTPTTLSMTLDSATFAEAPAALIAVPIGLGVPASASFTDGAVSLSLTAGSTYRLFVRVGGADVPVVLRSAEGARGAVVQVTGDGAMVDLGALRYWDAKATREVELTPIDIVETDECVDGSMSVSGTPCSNESATVVCADEDGEDHREGRGRKGRHGDRDHDDDDTAVAEDITVDPELPMVVTEFNLDIQIGCGMVGC
jgi:hypothetical protein